ncbi:hypothetical protein Acr_14g0004240 [Actinidia rufa]|uniref:RNase H type-1 domain-containing protein n=1 Tax=Actinidia rufa TaxID=165716 RepID=A0A7J0FPZ5_9ERIC|nr:hypothetical protein Acr_14g0004240 [Actinidia rufa]
MNTDAISWGDIAAAGQSGCGGLIQDDNGNWIKASTAGSIEAEVWAIYRGLTIILEDGLDQVEINIDSETAMEIIRDGPFQKPLSRLLPLC